MKNQRQSQADSKQIFARNLRTWLLERDISGAELARRLGDYSRAGISQWTRGEAGPDLATIGRITEILDIPLHELFRDEDDEKRPAPPKTKRQVISDGERLLRDVADRLGYDVVRIRPKKAPPH